MHLGKMSAGGIEMQVSVSEHILHNFIRFLSLLTVPFPRKFQVYYYYLFQDRMMWAGTAPIILSKVPIEVV
jgi:hypothetical protein